MLKYYLTIHPGGQEIFENPCTDYWHCGQKYEPEDYATVWYQLNQGAAEQFYAFFQLKN
jgi:hypothetical protein